MKENTSSDVLADLQAVCRLAAEGKKPDKELARRVKDRADKVRQEVFSRHGILDIGAPAIRALRDGEDE